MHIQFEDVGTQRKSEA